MDEDEAALLAELRAISSGQQRFQQLTEKEDGAGMAGDHPSPDENNAPASTSAVTSDVHDAIGNDRMAKAMSKGTIERSLPPWKQNRAAQAASSTTAPDSEFLVVDRRAAHNATSNGHAVSKQAEADVATNGIQMMASRPPMTMGIRSEFPSTFSGDRGGDAHDEDLLAELRAISQKSSSGDRFEREEIETGRTNHLLPPPSESPPPSASPSQPLTMPGSPAPLYPSPMRSLSPVLSPSPRSRRDAGKLPPWKTAGRSRKAASLSPPPPPVSETAPTDDATSLAPLPAPRVQTFGIQSDLPSAFVGERGGAANDDDLLAELRAISQKSSSAHRFAGDAADNDEAVSPIAASAPAPPKASTKTTANKERSLPLWKRNKSRQPKSAASASDGPLFGNTVQSKVASEPEPRVETFGIKPDLRSTFVGDRGGDAHDDELLAELLAISQKSSNNGRFAKDDGMEEPEARTAPKGAPAQSDSTVSVPATRISALTNDDEVPGERKSKALNKPSQPGVAIAVPPRLQPSEVPFAQAGSVVSMSTEPPPPSPDEKKNGQGSGWEPLPQYGIKSDLPSTFQGDRGGPAEDAELLALLRGVSHKTGGSSRFDVATDSSVGLAPSAMPNPSSGAQTKNEVAVARPKGGHPASARHAIGAPPQTQSSDELNMSSSDLASALVDKNWKTRCAAYESLARLVADKAAVTLEAGQVSSDEIVEDLDALVPPMMEDTNAGALDKALEFGLVYAEHCRSAGNFEQVRVVMKSLFRKNAFASRPTTLKLANDFSLKLMEVGTNGVKSLHAAIDVTLEDGCTSKKPKVVQAAVSLVLEAAIEFSAAALPLASIIAVVPKLLANPNAKVRETTIQILVEICRSLESKDPLQGVFDSMKKAQLSEIDAQLESQRIAAPPKRTLRSRRDPSSESSSTTQQDIAQAMQVDVKSLEAERFAKRPAIDILSALSKTEYTSKLQLKKWSEKVAALDLVIESAGEKPFKLAQPSPSVSYAPLISDMKNLLFHTHFAVASKAMSVLAVLAEGVGEKLFPHLRPLLSTLLQLAKDKKLTKAVAACLDSFFGNVLGFNHLFEPDDALPDASNERKQKNALARCSAVAFLARCVQRNEDAGPRGILSSENAQRAALLCVENLDDSDVSVRKAATDCLKMLQDGLHSRTVAPIIERLKELHARVHKQLQGDPDTKAAPAKPSLSSSMPSSGAKLQPRIKAGSPKTLSGLATGPVSASQRNSEAINEDKVAATQSSSIEQDESLDQALSYVATLNIDQWDSTEDNGGVLAGLKASKWLLRQDAIRALAAYLQSGSTPSEPEAVCTCSKALCVIVKEHTRGFKETNVNVMKSILEFFRSLTELHLSADSALPEYVAEAGADICVQKISDRKLHDQSKVLLTELCAVAKPSSVVLTAFGTLDSVKSPIAHEELLQWMVTFLNDFGAKSLGVNLSDVINAILKEFRHANAKVKRASLDTLLGFHSQLGSPLRALVLSLSVDQQTKNQLESSLPDVMATMHDTVAFPRRSLVLTSATGAGKSASIEIPRANFFSELSSDCTEKLQSKDGKAAWKIRKEALESTEIALKRCAGLIESDGPSATLLMEHVRALRDRLSDTQINLKPLAAKTIGLLLGKVDRAMQARLGRVVFGPLINAAMNDIKKPMRDASLDALRAGIEVSQLDGGGANSDALEALVASLVHEVTEKTNRAGGLPEVLLLFCEIAPNLANLDSVVSARGQALGDKYAVVIVECLTSSKSETRSAASDLLKMSIEHHVIGLESLKTATTRLKPALQRSVGPMIASFETLRPQNLPSGGKSLDSNKATISSPTKPAKKSAELQKDTQGKMTAPAEEASHPLRQSTAALPQTTQTTVRWPEYPEEPSSPSLLASLKKAWSRLLPATSCRKLFPPNGIQKQDDAIEGCDVLLRAFDADELSHSRAAVEQLDFILKWLVYVLCSKEATVGLNAILAVSSRLFAYLVSAGRQLSDAEAMMVAPFYFDRAAIARGRFSEPFNDVAASLESENLVPAKTLGSSVCVSILERSIHAKARLSAYRMISTCLASSGLAGVGKKGVVVCAKLMTDEKIPENKAAVLDLMTAVLNRMNGDVEKLAKICGTNLTESGRELLNGRNTRVLPNEMTSTGTPFRSSVNRLLVSEAPVLEGDSKYDLFDQLPPLSLRPPSLQRDAHGTLATSPASAMDTNQTESSNAFVFNAPTVSAGHSLPGLGQLQSMQSLQIESPADFARSELPQDASSEGRSVASRGAAASLRARLLKVREKSRHVDFQSESASAATSLSESRKGTDLFERCMLDFHSLLEIPSTETSEDDAKVNSCIDAVKMIHGALSGHSATIDLTKDELLSLRATSYDRLNEMISPLIKLVGHAFQHSEVAINAGLSVPLLSVCLAALMALFRDTELAQRVTQDSLVMLIREAGTALLDDRLSSTSDLDPVTTSQMVRAINKLAVQAATCAKRHISFQALMVLQQQIAVADTGTGTANGDSVFNGRLSRVVAKLFSRVIKAEESRSSGAAFSHCENMDTESLVCCMDDVLVGCDDLASDLAQNCIEMVRSLVAAMAAAQNGTNSLRQVMAELEIDLTTSKLGDVVRALEADADDVDAEDEFVDALTDAPTFDGPPLVPMRNVQGKDVAMLVAKLANAPFGTPREEALDALRQFRDSNGGDEELKEHLKDVSSPFRAYIEEKLGPVASTLAPSAAPTADPPRSAAMSERLKSLRTRLQATELAVQVVADGSAGDDASGTSDQNEVTAARNAPFKSRATHIPSPNSTNSATKFRGSRLAQPSPSKVSSTTDSQSSFRDRMKSAEPSQPASAMGDAAKGRAAVLRARLEAVKNQHK